MASIPITRYGHARIGILGNPGDAFGGPAIAAAIGEFRAQASTDVSERLCLQEPPDEMPEWNNLESLDRRVHRYGCVGGRPLMQALLARLSRYARDHDLYIPRDRNLSLTWSSRIPPRVGLGGSSALLTAALRAVTAFWGLHIPPLQQVDILLRCEREDLGIPAGPQDRVAQVFEGAVYLEQHLGGVLHVETIPSTVLPPLFVAIDERGAEGTEVLHSHLRERFLRHDPEALEAIREWGRLTRKGRELLMAGRGEELGPLMDENFELRRRVVPLNPRHVAMVDTARRAGAHAKFAGSGGAIVGTCALERMDAVLAALREHGYTAFQPRIQNPSATV